MAKLNNIIVECCNSKETTIVKHYVKNDNIEYNHFRYAIITDESRTRDEMIFNSIKEIVEYYPNAKDLSVVSFNEFIGLSNSIKKIPQTIEFEKNDFGLAKKLYCFIASQSVANEIYMSFKEDLIRKEKEALDSRLEKIINREEKRRYLKFANDKLDKYKISLDRYEKATSGLLKYFEGDEKSEDMLNDMIESLVIFLKDSADANVVKL
jgi:hypothetical protein